MNDKCRVAVMQYGNKCHFVDEAKRQGAIEVFDLIKKYHSPKSLGFECWNKIEKLVGGKTQ